LFVCFILFVATLERLAIASDSFLIAYKGVRRTDVLKTQRRPHARTLTDAMCNIMSFTPRLAHGSQGERLNECILRVVLREAGPS
jgi:hypothetical protein